MAEGGGEANTAVAVSNGGAEGPGIEGVEAANSGTGCCGGRGATVGAGGGPFCTKFCGIEKGRSNRGTGGGGDFSCCLFTACGCVCGFDDTTIGPCMGMCCCAWCGMNCRGGGCCAGW